MRRLLLAALVAAGALLGWAAAASAGTYDVTTCNFDTPGGVDHAWSYGVFGLPNTNPDPATYRLTGGCASPEGYTISSNPAAAQANWGTWAVLRFAAPAGTQIVGLTLSRYSSVSRTQTPGGNQGRWERLSQLSDASDLGGPLGADQCRPGGFGFPDPCTSGAPGRATNATVHYSLATGAVSIGIICSTDTANFAPCRTANGSTSLGFVNFKAARVTISDPTAPSLTATGGLLSGPGWHRTTEPVTWSSSDSTGIAAVHLFVDGHESGVDALPCDYTFPAPCPNATNRQVSLRPSVPDGRHTLQVVAVDAAANQSPPITQAVAIDGHGPNVTLLPPRGRSVVVRLRDRFSGVAGASLAVRYRPSGPFQALAARRVGGRLSARLPHGRARRVGVRVAATDHLGNVSAGQVTTLALRVRRRGRSRVFHRGHIGVGYGRSATLTGRLTTRDRQPLAGQRFTLVARVRQTGARRRAAGTATTNAHGRFALRLPAGPSRDLVLTYPGAPDLLPLTRHLSMRVRAKSTIHASRTVLGGSGRVTFSGRLGLKGARVPAGGKLVELQAFDGGRWRIFGSAHARGSKGRWHFTYAFSGRAGRFPVRVRIRREAVFPYDLGYSRAVVIRVL